MRKNVVKIGADGGCRGNGKKENVGGYGVIMEYVDNNNKLHVKEFYQAECNTTNNIQELKSCIAALKAIKDKNAHIELYTDSRYVNDGLTKWISNWKQHNWITSSKQAVKNKELWEELDTLMMSMPNLKIIWIKGHANHKLNIKADMLANQAMDEYLLKATS